MSMKIIPPNTSKHTSTQAGGALRGEYEEHCTKYQFYFILALLFVLRFIQLNSSANEEN